MLEADDLKFVAAVVQTQMSQLNVLWPINTQWQRQEKATRNGFLWPFFMEIITAMHYFAHSAKGLISQGA